MSMQRGLGFSDFANVTNIII